MNFVYNAFLRRFLFRFDPEKIHEMVESMGTHLEALPSALGIFNNIFNYKSPRLETTFSSLRFSNPVGMAAGYDKTGRLYPLLSNLGFGYVESGTFTATEQSGNPRPRIFRFPEQCAIVNRMGFNNPGAEKAARIIKTQKRSIPRGINIGKSRKASLDKATDDYLFTLRTLREFADYFTLNVSSPNTPGLRQLQGKKYLRELVIPLKNELSENRIKQKIPLFIKISPDLSDSELDAILEVVTETRIDAIIISNTTVDKSSLPVSGKIEGGLSGQPLRQRCLQIIGRTYSLTAGKLPIIGVGGIFSGKDALEAIQMGAGLIQIYTGFIYNGPGLPSAINAYLDEFCRKEGLSISEFIGSKNNL